MPKQEIITPHYSKLVKSIAKILTEGLKEAERLLEQHRLKTYWFIGKTISSTSEASNGSIQLTKSLYAQISRDIETLNKGSRYLNKSECVPVLTK